MAPTKQAESASNAKTGRDGARAGVLTVPRAWLAGLAALVVVPWLIVSAVYFSSPSSTAKEGAGRPVVAVPAGPGPWGRLEITPIVVSPPLEYVSDDLVFSKNGTSPVSPWIIMPVERLKAYYRGLSASPRLIYHRHGRL